MYLMALFLTAEYSEVYSGCVSRNWIEVLEVCICAERWLKKKNNHIFIYKSLKREWF